MTPLKWYEKISLTFSFIPFRWRLRCGADRDFDCAYIGIGPFWLSVGFPG